MADERRQEAASTPAGRRTRTHDYGMADPEVYEPLAEDPWCGDDPPDVVLFTGTPY